MLILKKTKPIIITAALPYANFYLHLGHLYSTFLPADILNRALKKKKYKVKFVSGSDCFGTPVVITAIKQKTTNKKIVNYFHIANLKSLSKLDIHLDVFDKTDSKKHINFVLNFFKEQNYILKQQRISSNYCQFDKLFLPERLTTYFCDTCKKNIEEELVKTHNHSLLKFCTICEREIINKEHEIVNMLFTKKNMNYFLKHVKYSHTTKQLIDNFYIKQKSWKSIVRQMNWGVKSPFKNMVFYVWFEALLSYISFVGKKEWCESYKIQFFGKDNLFFHTYMTANIYQKLNLFPNEIISNFFLKGKQKFSKSSGYGIFLNNLNEKLTSPLRLYLLHIINTHDDAIFEKQDFVIYIKNIYINQIINTFQRINYILRKNGIIIYDTFQNKSIDLIINKNYTESYKELINNIKDIGSFIQTFKLWENKKLDDISLLISKLFVIYETLTIFTPSLAKKLSNYFVFNNGRFKIKKNIKQFIDYQDLINLANDKII